MSGVRCRLRTPAKAGVHVGLRYWAPAFAGARPPKGEHGFTLIEMMVALAIFSLIALTLIKLQGAILRNSGEIEARALGQVVAHNMAVELMTDPRPPAIGKAEGQTVNGGRSWHWIRETRSTADPRLVRIDIAVADDAGRPSGALSLARAAQ